MDVIKVFEKSEEVQRLEPSPNPFWIVFMISFPSENQLNLYVTFWKDVSRVIQREPGARGTRLHRVHGSEPAVLVIAEWESAETRIAAYQKMNAKMPIDAVVASFIADFGGKVTIIAKATEIAAVLP